MEYTPLCVHLVEVPSIPQISFTYGVTQPLPVLFPFNQDYSISAHVVDVPNPTIYRLYAAKLKLHEFLGTWRRHHTFDDGLEDSSWERSLTALEVATHYGYIRRQA